MSAAQIVQSGIVTTDAVREMGECKGSVSPKLDKACIDGDSEEFDGKQTSRFRSSAIESRKGHGHRKEKLLRQSLRLPRH